MSRVNLLPSEIKKGQETRRRFVLFVLAGIALILLVVAFWFIQSMRLSDVQSQWAAEGARYDASGLGRKGALHVGDTTWMVGLMFEF